MKKIICIIKPFALKQNIYVYDEDVELEHVVASMSDMPQMVFALVEKHNVKKLDLVGPKQFLYGIRKSIKNYDLSAYGLGDLEINII